MRSSVPKEGMLHSKEEESYLSMFDQELSLKMAKWYNVVGAEIVTLLHDVHENLSMATISTQNPDSLAKVYR